MLLTPKIQPVDPSFPEEKDLLERPTFNFRLQIILSFFTFFVLLVLVSLVAMVTINHIEKRISTVQTLERFLFNVEQARRWEKNFFLYSTNLQDALQSAEEAGRLLERNIEQAVATTRLWKKEEIKHHLDLYHAELQRLSKQAGTGNDTPKARTEVESNLRRFGSRIVEEAAAMAVMEHEQVARWLHLLQKVPLYFLLFLFFLMIYMTRFLSLRFMRPLKNLIYQTRRIAKGDFTPVKPCRRFRDEFTTVEVAINRMLRELESHQNSLIESHKLRAIGILTAGVAHELNNPLNNIMLTAHALREEYADLNPEEHLGMVRDIIGETERSRDIVHNLLDFTRENKSIMGPIHLGRLVEETTKLALNQARVRGIPIHVKIEPDLPDILGDRQKLKQVFLNLLLNALDAVGKDGRIQVRVQPALSNCSLIVEVEDNGSGIPPDVIPYIFDPFFTTKPVGKGTGLGLSVSHGIITQHGGTIQVNSTPNQSTVFTVCLFCYPFAAGRDESAPVDGAS